MRKEFIVKSIDAAPDGAPYVIVSLTSPKDFKESSQQPANPFGPKVMNFSNMNDMMKEFNKMFSGQGNQGNVTSIKLDMYEYKELNISVGDKVYLELTKAESLDV